MTKLAIALVLAGLPGAFGQDDAATETPNDVLVQSGAAPATAGGAPGTPGVNGPAAVDRLDLGTTSITGNQELPKVLYIVPWQRSDLGELVGRPVDSLLDEVLAPVDPDVFERHLSYHEALHGDSNEE